MQFSENFTVASDSRRISAMNVITPSVSVGHIGLTQVPHCGIPNYTEQIYTELVRLCNAYRNQQSVIACTRQEIDAHEQIDLAKLSLEIKELSGEIKDILASENALVGQQRAYRAHGILRNVFIHGFSQISLSLQLSKLRDEKASLLSRQSKLNDLVNKRESFDFADKGSLLKRQEEELGTIERDYNVQRARFDGFNSQMKGFVDRIAGAARQLNAEIDHYNILSQYAAELDAASNAYERFCVHRKCEETFGDGSVGRLRGQLRSRIMELADRYNAQVNSANIHAREIGLIAA